RAEVVEIMSGEVAATPAWAEFNIGFAAEVFRAAAAAVTAPRGEVLTDGRENVIGLAVREPLGVVAAFAPWNAPLILSARAVAAPLAAGNSVVLRPSEAAPLSSGLFVADILREAGLPDGVLNVITNDIADADVIARALVSDPRVNAVNFTGSTNVGRIIGTLAAEALKPAVLELGGKNAILVLEDADVDYAVKAAIFGAYANSGQICMSADRILVHRSLVKEFTEKFSSVVSHLPFGGHDEPGVVVGPLVSESSARRLAALIADAVAKGGTVLAGGGSVEGAIHPPTVLTDVPVGADLHHAEAFGPVCVIEAFDTDEEAVAKANDTEHGLTAGIITDNGTHGLRVAQRLRTGIVHINDQSVADDPEAPFGGVSASGYGRFGGRWGIEAFSSTRWVTLATEQMPFPG
ncbi:aldehyde dehydrogenase family protein, partial [Nocardia asiatica]|uniref:aldehyde dehydrogenase family protein n=1 Tax=Nocardia asiatica TaxID=209252 RepID=UPI0005C2371D